MTYRFDGYNWMIRLEKGEKLISSLTALIEKEKIKTAWIYGLGAADQVEIGFYDLEKKEYEWKKLDKELEILSLQGNISLIDEGPSIHIHGTFSGGDMQTFGGHVKDLTVSVTCELFLHNWFSSDGITRSLDKDTGLKLLDL